MENNKTLGERYPHTYKMTLKQWKAFRGNFESKLTCKNYLLKAKHKTFEDFIDGAFIWKKTNEGSDYWANIWYKRGHHDL